MASQLGLVAVYVVRAPLDEVDAGHPDHWLNVVSGAWRARTAQGFHDTLLLVGAGFEDEVELRARLAPFGLLDAELLALDIDEDDFYSTGDPKEQVLADSMEHEVGKWLRRRRPSAIPVVSPPRSMPGVNYGGQPWWLGLIHSGDQGHSKHVPVLASLIDRALAGQEPTWLEVLTEIVRPCLPFDRVDDFASSMAIASLARWIAGFRAATGDNFDFDYGDALAAIDISDFRLGIEGARTDLGTIDIELLEDGEHAARTAAFRELLQSERFLSSEALREFFGGSASLFFTMHAALWPKLSRPVHEAYDGLLNLKYVEMGEIEAAWMFVHRGYWGDIE